MGVINKARLAGLLSIPSRAASKGTGNKGARFKAFVVRNWTKLQAMVLFKGLAKLGNKLRIDRNIKTFRATPAKMLAHNYLIGNKYHDSQGSEQNKKLDQDIERLVNNKNIEINLKDIGDLENKADQMKDLAGRMRMMLQSEQAKRKAADEALAAGKLEEVRKYNLELIDRQIENATAPGASRYIATKVDRKLVRLLQPGIGKLEGDFPTRSQMFRLIDQAKKDSTNLFADNDKAIEDFRNEQNVPSHKLLTLNQDKVDDMLAVTLLEKRLEEYLNSKAEEGKRDPLFQFFYDNGEELGIPHIYSRGNEEFVPDQFRKKTGADSDLGSVSSSEDIWKSASDSDPCQSPTLKRKKRKSRRERSNERAQRVDSQNVAPRARQAFGPAFQPGAGGLSSSESSSDSDLSSSDDEG